MQKMNIWLFQRKKVKNGNQQKTFKLENNKNEGINLPHL